MTQLSYCKTCILPNTRPNLLIDDKGNCNGCASTEKKKIIDWDNRKKQFEQLVQQAKNNAQQYDCLIPVSGGKDSTWQVIKALEYGLKPLCVTWKTPARNQLGAANLQNLIQLGVNHIDFSINPKVERLFTRKTFERMGSPVLPMHMALHAIPLQVAVNFRIPLILWGENSAFEYGGEDKILQGFSLTHSWLKKYGVTNGTIAQDWIDNDLSPSDLRPYFWPSDEEQEKVGVKAIFLGHFFRWDPLKTYEIAKKNGFQAGKIPKTGYYSFADIDDEFLITIHHWIKWYKFGFTRLWDNLSLEIRNKRITRKQAIDIIFEAGNELPLKEISDFCHYIKITEKKFYETMESFRNKNIWNQDINNKWYLKNFLVDNWEW